MRLEMVPLLSLKKLQEITADPFITQQIHPYLWAEKFRPIILRLR